MTTRLSPAPRTEAEDYVERKLNDLLSDSGSKYRVGAIFLTYGAGSDEEPGCRIAQCVGMREVTMAGAVDLLQLIKAFRHLADILEAQYELGGKQGVRKGEG